MVTVATFGAGVNGTAMLIEAARRGISLDAILFADTKAETGATQRHLVNFNEWLIARGYPSITVVTNQTTTLEADCLKRQALPAVAYGFKTCSLRFKKEPQDKWLAAWPLALDAWARGERVEKWMGFDYGEPQRARNFSDAKFYQRYPLIEWELDRDDCAAICRETLGYEPDKSACFFCPNRKKHEIKKLAREEPCLFERAVAIERNAELVTIKGLGRRFSWEQYVNTDKAQDFLFEELEYDEPCECYDG